MKKIILVMLVIGVGFAFAEGSGLGVSKSKRRINLKFMPYQNKPEPLSDDEINLFTNACETLLAKYVIICPERYLI